MVARQPIVASDIPCYLLLPRAAQVFIEYAIFAVVSLRSRQLLKVNTRQHPAVAKQRLLPACCHCLMHAMKGVSHGFVLHVCHLSRLKFLKTAAGDGANPSACFRLL
jgi:hypothetical protein